MIIRVAIPTLVCATMLLWNLNAASADRMPIPTTSICNKSKTKLYVAKATIDTYIGWQNECWTLVKPKTCTDFRNDAFHFRGKRTVRGFSTRSLPGCVTYQKVFSLIMGNWDAAQSPKKCKAKKGRVVRFTYPVAGPKVRIDVVK